MPDIIKNTSTINRYQYVVDPSQDPTTKGPIFDDAENPFVAAAVGFTKVCNPQYVDVGQTFTINYTVSNNTPAPATYPKFDNVLINDNIVLTSSLITVTPGANVTNFDQAAGTFKVDLNSVGGTLDPGESVIATLSVTVNAAPANPADLNTTATANFDVQDSTKQFTATSTCGVTVNHGELTITKDSDPVGTVSCGQTITYTILITNIGNVPVTILAGEFSDPIPDGTTFGAIIAPTPAEFVHDVIADKIVNNSNVVIAAGASITIKFTVTVDC